jgi:Zn ribbon nucleic-acid-binding protein
MGEWADYFEDFPEENPATYVGDRFNPELAETIRQEEQKILDAREEINKLLLNAWLNEKEKHYLATEECPQCGLKELKVYNLNNYYLCECQDCGTYGKGKTHKDATIAIINALGDGLDWREINGPNAINGPNESTGHPPKQ